MKKLRFGIRIGLAKWCVSFLERIFKRIANRQPIKLAPSRAIRVSPDLIRVHPCPSVVKKNSDTVEEAAAWQSSFVLLWEGGYSPHSREVAVKRIILRLALATE
jgi:hypothetical protein